MTKKDIKCPICHLSDTIRKLDDISNEQDKDVYKRATNRVNKKLMAWNFLSTPGEMFSLKRQALKTIYTTPILITMCICALFATPFENMIKSINISENTGVFVGSGIIIILILLSGPFTAKFFRFMFVDHVNRFDEHIKKGLLFYCKRDDIVFNSKTLRYRKPEDVLDIVRN